MAQGFANRSDKGVSFEGNFGKTGRHSQRRPTTGSLYVLDSAVIRPYNPCNLGLSTYWDGSSDKQGDKIWKKNVLGLMDSDPLWYK